MLKVALDPGHFGGVFSVLEDRHFQAEKNSFIKEGELNLKVAFKLKPLLENRGIKVLLTRESFANYKDVEKITPNEFEKFRINNLKQRAQIVNAFKPDFSVSIHFNSNCYSSDFFPTEKNGVMTFIINDEKELVEKAKIVAKNLSEEFQLGFCEKNWFFDHVANLWTDLGEGVNVRDLFILREIKTPIVLSEGPMMNNLEVYKSLVENDNLIDVYVQALYKSITRILKIG